MTSTLHGAPWSPTVVDALRAAVDSASAESVEAIMAELPAYREEFRAGAQVLQEAVAMALYGFLDLIATSGRGSAPARPTMLGARGLGRSEARAGRSVETVLAAYRVGGRVCWVTFSDVALAQGLEARDLQAFAALTFAYIDDLSAATVAGHTEERAHAERSRTQARAHLGLLMLRGARSGEVDRSARAAGLTSPSEVVPIICRTGDVPALTARMPLRTLTVDQIGVGAAGSGWSTMLLGDPTEEELRQTRRGASEAGVACLVGPVVPRATLPDTWRLASRWAEVPPAPRLGGPARREGPLELTDVLPHLVVHGDPVAAEALAREVLAPLAVHGEQARERLVETLRTWILLRGQRALVAEHLGVHPQTVRYRMTQVRTALGPELDNPERAAAILLACLVVPEAG